MYYIKLFGFCADGVGPFATLDVLQTDVLRCAVVLLRHALSLLLGQVVRQGRSLFAASNTMERLQDEEHHGTSATPAYYGRDHFPTNPVEALRCLFAGPPPPPPGASNRKPRGRRPREDKLEQLTTAWSPSSRGQARTSGVLTRTAGTGPPVTADGHGGVSSPDHCHSYAFHDSVCFLVTDDLARFTELVLEVANEVEAGEEVNTIRVLRFDENENHVSDSPETRVNSKISLLMQLALDAIPRGKVCSVVVVGASQETIVRVLEELEERFDRLSERNFRLYVALSEMEVKNDFGGLAARIRDFPRRVIGVRKSRRGSSSSSDAPLPDNAASSCFLDRLVPIT